MVNPSSSESVLVIKHSADDHERCHLFVPGRRGSDRFENVLEDDILEVMEKWDSLSNKNHHYVLI
jgi:hypothetical protein